MKFEANLVSLNIKKLCSFSTSKNYKQHVPPLEELQYSTGLLHDILDPFLLPPIFQQQIQGIYHTTLEKNVQIFIRYQFACFWIHFSIICIYLHYITGPHLFYESP